MPIIELWCTSAFGVKLQRPGAQFKFNKEVQHQLLGQNPKMRAIDTYISSVVSYWLTQLAQLLDLSLDNIVSISCEQKLRAFLSVPFGYGTSFLGIELFNSIVPKTSCEIPDSVLFLFLNKMINWYR